MKMKPDTSITNISSINSTTGHSTRGRGANADTKALKKLCYCLIFALLLIIIAYFLYSASSSITSGMSNFYAGVIGSRQQTLNAIEKNYEPACLLPEISARERNHTAAATRRTTRQVHNDTDDASNPHANESLRSNGGSSYFTLANSSRRFYIEDYNFYVDPKDPQCPSPTFLKSESLAHCPDEDIYVALWMLIRDSRRPEHRGRPFTIVDIGCNKGYSVAGMIEALNLTVPMRRHDPTSIHHTDFRRVPHNVALNNTNVAGFFSREALALDIFHYAQGRDKLPPRNRNQLLGACCDGTEKSPYHPLRSLSQHPWHRMKAEMGGLRTGDVHVPEVEAFLVDGTKTHVDYVTQFFNAERERYYSEINNENNNNNNNERKKTNFTFHFLHRALSNKTGVTHFCDQELGSEVGSICDDKEAGGGGAVIETEMTTLDRMMPPHVQKIDVLLTDTEGHDFDVLEGARERWLRDGNVGIYIFELHQGPNQRPVESVVAELESFGYTCYIPIHGHKLSRHLVRISPIELCWMPNYNKILRGWNNAVCAHEENFPELKYVFHELSKLPKNRGFGSCPLTVRFFEEHPWRNWNWALAARMNRKKREKVRKVVEMRSRS